MARICVLTGALGEWRPSTISTLQGSVFEEDVACELEPNGWGARLDAELAGKLGEDEWCVVASTAAMQRGSLAVLPLFALEVALTELAEFPSFAEGAKLVRQAKKRHAQKPRFLRARGRR